MVAKVRRIWLKQRDMSDVSEGWKGLDWTSQEEGIHGRPSYLWRCFQALPEWTFHTPPTGELLECFPKRASQTVTKHKKDKMMSVERFSISASLIFIKDKN